MELMLNIFLCTQHFGMKKIIFFKVHFHFLYVIGYIMLETFHSVTYIFTFMRSWPKAKAAILSGGLRV